MNDGAIEAGIFLEGHGKIKEGLRVWRELGMEAEALQSRIPNMV